MKVTKSILALSTLLLCVPVKADNGAVSFVKDVTILVATPFVAAIKSLGALVISQVKKHPKAFCVTAVTAALAYGTKVSYSSLLHARRVVHSVEDEINVMQREGNYLTPTQVSASNIPNWLTVDFLRILTQGRPEKLRKFGLCLCGSSANIIQRFNSAITKRITELDELSQRLDSCRFVGKGWYHQKIQDLNVRINIEYGRTIGLESAVNCHDRTILAQYAQCNGYGLGVCHKRYCMNKQQVCICDGLGPAYGCQVCDRRS